MYGYKCNVGTSAQLFILLTYHIVEFYLMVKFFLLNPTEFIIRNNFIMFPKSINKVYSNQYLGQQKKNQINKYRILFGDSKKMFYDDVCRVATHEKGYNEYIVNKKNVNNDINVMLCIPILMKTFSPLKTKSHIFSIEYRIGIAYY